MNTPTHEEVALGAHELWLNSGRTEGRDLDNWLEAEKGLSTAEAAPDTIGTAIIRDAHIPGDSPAEHAVAEIAAEQRQEARAPIRSRKSAPHAKPPETGKPLWNQPHSR